MLPHKVSIATMEDSTSPSFLLPPKPEEPFDSECCGTGCTPCVFDIYKEKVKRWENDCIKIRAGESLQEGSSPAENSISPYEYALFIVKEITEDCLNCKIIRFQRYHETEEHSSYFLNDKLFPVKLGQHVLIRINEKCRQYTVLDVRKDGFQIVFKVYENGQLTPLVDKVVVGSKVEMRGPFGNEFIYEPNQYKSLVIFAAGTGIAPFSRIIDSVLENELDETRIIFCYACRNEDELILLEKLKEWTRSWNFQIKYFLSSVKDEGRAKKVHYGSDFSFRRIDKAVIEDICKRNFKALYMICGTKSFEKDIVNYLKSVDVEEDLIKTF